MCTSKGINPETKNKNNMNAAQIVAQIVKAINAGALPHSAIKTSAKSIHAAYPCTKATAQEAAWMLSENFA